MRSNGRVVWLWWWLGVLVAGCSQVTFSGTGTAAPTLSIFNLTRTPITPTPILRLLRTPTPHNPVARTRIAPTPLPVPLTPPDCYETPVGSLWCLGLVRNPLTTPIEQVTLQVYLVSADGTALTDANTMLSLAVLGPGESAPYGVLFNSIPQDYAGPVVVLTSTRTAQSVKHAELEVHDLRYEVADSLYSVHGTLVNTASVPVKRLTVVVTLFDANGRVTGFRQAVWPADQTLAPQGSLSFQLDVAPQGLGTMRVEATAEAWAE